MLPLSGYPLLAAEARYPAMEATVPRPPSLTDVGSQLRDAVQVLTNSIAEETLVGRRILDVVRTDMTVPAQVALAGPERLTPWDDEQFPGPVPLKQMPAVTPGTLLFTTARIDPATAEAIVRYPGQAGSKELVQAVRNLAVAEDLAVFRGLLSTIGVGSARDLLDAATALRASGHGGALVAVATAAALAAAAESRQLALLKQAFEGGLFVGQPWGSEPVRAVAIAPGPGSVYIAVGHNYAVDWLGVRDGCHEVQITASFATVVLDARAICVVPA